MSKPLTQIDNDGNAREMTDEEHAAYLEMIKDAPTLPTDPADA